MDGDPPMMRDWRIAGTTLDWMMPLHLVLDQAGTVLAHGPTVAAMFRGTPVVGRPLEELFELKTQSEKPFSALAGRKLRMVRQVDGVALRLKGLLMPMGGHWLLNLSFGIDLPRAVALLQLTAGDFATTDLAIELLYLVEANDAVTGELRGLAQRLDTARAMAREEALTDTLTGLKNRRACDSVLTRLCRTGAAFGLMHMDLDYFKAVNDTLGHAAGDHVLMQVAGILKANARTQDCIARVGGDEFVLLLPGMTDADLMGQLARHVIRLLSQPIPFQENLCRVSASFGYLVVPEGEPTTPEQAMARADLALYAAKNAGRGRAVMYSLGLEQGSEGADTVSRQA